jgi:uncharacterized protein YndB with AHSA1/START domain
VTEVTESIQVDVEPSVVWAAVSDPASYARWSPEAVGVRRRGAGSGPWTVGDRFTGINRTMVTWVTQCRVVVAEPDSEFAFEADFGPLPVSRWAYELAADAGGTRVTERWTDRRTGLAGFVMRPAGWMVGRGADAARHNRRTMRATLEAMKAELEARG